MEKQILRPETANSKSQVRKHLQSHICEMVFVYLVLLPDYTYPSSGGDNDDNEVLLGVL